MHRAIKHIARASLCAFLALSCTFGLSGCLESDVLVNFVLDPTSDNIDYSNPNKNYVPDPDAKLTSKDVAATTHKSTEEIDKVLEDTPVYDTKKTNTEKTAESGEHSKTSNSATTAAQQRESARGKKVKSSKNNSSDKKQGGSGKKSKGTAGSSGTGDNDSKATEPGATYNGNGKLENLPTDLKSVCAVGDAAAIVLSIAGPGHLTGSSEDFLKNKNARKVFGAKTLSNTKTCWNNAGENSDDIDASAIIKLKPSAVLTLTGSSTVSSAAREKLQEAGISVIALPRLVSDTYIKKAVRAVGRLFTDATGGDSASKADSYVSTVNKVLDAAKSTHGGTVSTYNSVDYDNVTDANPTNSKAGGATNWTLYVSGWDSDATVSASFDGRTIFRDTGVGTVQTGWKWSPISYYLGCGGAVNNAAAYGSYSTPGKHLFLNYNENQVSYTWKNLDANVALGKNNGSFRQGGAYTLANACDARDSDTDHHLGSSDFNKVIVKTKKMKTQLSKARGNSLGLYTPGTYQKTATMSGYGLKLDGKILRCYTTQASASAGGKLYSIYVNPCGIIGSWSDGSMESYLEAAWAASVFCGYDESKLEKNVSDFYSDFYGYDLSQTELDGILDGSYADD